MEENKRIKYRKGYKYQLAEDAYFFVPWLKQYEFKVDYIEGKDGWVRVCKGYAWDGASGPTLDTKSTMRGSLIHDVLYQLMRMEVIPRKFKTYADRYFAATCEDDGMWFFRQLYFHSGVHYFGNSSVHPDHVKPVYTAP